MGVRHNTYTHPHRHSHRRTAMADTTISLKCCSRKEMCLHSDGPWLPATTEYFMSHKGGLYCQCHECRREAKRQSHVRNREHNNARTSAWYEQHKDEVSEQRKERAKNDPEYAQQNRDRANQWRAENPERKQASGKARYWSNPEEHRAEGRAYYWQNPTAGRARAKEWRLTNPERHKELNRRYIQRHPDKARAKAANRRALKRNAPGKFGKADIQLQFKSQHGKCWHCGKKLTDGYHADHLIPLNRGGTNDPRNIVLSCPHCNTSRRDRFTHEWNGRLL